MNKEQQSFSLCIAIWNVKTRLRRRPPIRCNVVCSGEIDQHEKLSYESDFKFVQQLHHVHWHSYIALSLLIPFSYTFVYAEKRITQWIACTILSVNWRHITDLVSAKGKTKEVYCCDIVVLVVLFWCFWCVKDYNVVSVIETLSWSGCESISINFCFSLCRN